MIPACRNATQRPIPGPPAYVWNAAALGARVVFNPYAEGFRPRGCVAAAVYSVPPSPWHPGGLWLVCCYRDGGAATWTEGRLPDDLEVLP